MLVIANVSVSVLSLSHYINHNDVYNIFQNIMYISSSIANSEISSFLKNTLPDQLLQKGHRLGF